VKWGCSAIVHWPGEPSVEPPVFQIHGERDWLLPVHKERPDCVIPRAGHLINLTHAEEVNAYLRRKIAEVDGR
jgi:pimeloyl-ACP methyl ester carboxylesterase